MLRGLLRGAPKEVKPDPAALLEEAATATEATLILDAFDAEMMEAAAKVISTNRALQYLTIEFDPPHRGWKGALYNGPLHKALQRNTTILRLTIVGSRTPESWKGFVLRNNCLRIPPPAPPPANAADHGGDDNPLDGCEPADDRFTSLSPGDRIGGGAEGAVFRVEIDGVTVAAKTPFALQNPALYGLLDPVTGAEYRATVFKACMREVDALRRLDGHPNIVKFHSVRTTMLEGMVMPTWICMHLEDRTLHRRIYDGSCDFEADVRGILAGLEYLHSMGMMHRDIKPENILIALDGTVKLGDLGFAKVMHLLSRRRAAALTALGTPAYLAPEASNEDGVYDLSRDIYAFGVMIVEILLVEAPEATHDLRRPQFLRAAEASPDVAWLVERCTATDPASRPSSHSLKQWFESVDRNGYANNGNANMALSILNHGVGPYPPCEEAVRLLRSAADHGNPDAMCELGVCVFKGRGVHKNGAEAKAVWREAADKGSVEAPGHLALEDLDYRRSVDPALIDAAVARWRERAAQSHADAQLNLGGCFRLGVGVAKDDVEAVQWYRRSADQGCAMAQNVLGWCYNSGTGVAEDQVEAFRLQRMAADQGYARAQSNLGLFHEHGVGGVAKDPAKAVRLYRLSADQGDSAGQYFLGNCYKNGVGVEKDLAEAKRLLTLSAVQGDQDAQKLLQTI